jgi:Na+/proline symporter
MVSLRAIGAGLLAFLASVAYALLTDPVLVLLAGVVPGVVAGVFVAPGLRAGLTHGLLAGVCCGALVWVGLLAWLTFAPPERVAPGFGLSVALLFGFGVVVAVESLLAGGAIGLAWRWD